MPQQVRAAGDHRGRGRHLITIASRKVGNPGDRRRSDEGFPIEAIGGRPDRLPEGVAFAAARFPPLDAQVRWPARARMGQFDASLPPDLADAGGKRRSEFLAGRLCAMAALESAGRTPTVLKRDASGAPVWPADVVGSITHASGIACAAAADRLHYLGLGIDLEPVCEEAEVAQIAPSIFAPGERDALGPWAAGEADLVTLIFAVKEALYKCVAPTVRRFVDFGEAVVSVSGEAEVAVAPRGRLAPELAAYRVQAAVARFEGRRFAVCTMTAAAPHVEQPSRD